MRVISINQDRCCLCEECVDICVRSIYELKDDQITADDPSQCIFCGHCVAICPEDAILLPVVNMDEFEKAPPRENLPSPGQLMDLFRFRRSTRQYLDRPVEKEKIEMIIEAGRFAPTGGNLQPFRFSVVQDAAKLQSIKDLICKSMLVKTDQDEKILGEKIKKGEAFTSSEQAQYSYISSMRRMVQHTMDGADKILWGAPVLISAYAPSDFTESAVNAGLTGMQMSLMAESLGLGNCFIGFVVMAANSTPEIKQIMKIPESSSLVVALIVGYTNLQFNKIVSRKSARTAWT